ncbi:MAG: Peptidase C39 family protein [Syntrophorhabdus sp. PtaU1.Bin058]|nr:MAG: Peptidase C39 family protein [Syntrophorhabdus sp. PtaU1.Bin058]
MEKRRFLPIFILLFLLGCSTANPPVPPVDAVLLRGVPFFRQDDFQCGPSALATVIHYWYIKKNIDRRPSYDDIAAAVYSPSARGVLGIDLELYAKRLGFDATQYSGSVADIRDNINKEVPLIILVDYGFLMYQGNHFMVTTGYTNDGIVVNSGRKQNEIIPDGELEKIWQKTGYWSLRIQPSS